MLTPRLMIRALLAEPGASYTTVAERLGCSRSAVAGIATGRREGSEKILTRLGIARRVSYVRLASLRL